MFHFSFLLKISGIHWAQFIMDHNEQSPSLWFWWATFWPVFIIDIFLFTYILQLGLQLLVKLAHEALSARDALRTQFPLHLVFTENLSIDSTHLLHLWGQRALATALARGGRALPGVGGKSSNRAVGADDLLGEGDPRRSARWRRRRRRTRDWSRRCWRPPTPRKRRTTIVEALNRDDNLRWSLCRQILLITDCGRLKNVLTFTGLSLEQVAQLATLNLASRGGPSSALMDRNIEFE